MKWSSSSWGCAKHHRGEGLPRPGGGATRRGRAGARMPPQCPSPRHRQPIPPANTHAHANKNWKEGREAQHTFSTQNTRTQTHKPREGRRRREQGGGGARSLDGHGVRVLVGLDPNLQRLPPVLVHLGVGQTQQPAGGSGRARGAWWVAGWVRSASLPAAGGAPALKSTTDPLGSKHPAGVPP